MLFLFCVLRDFPISDNVPSSSGIELDYRIQFFSVFSDTVFFDESWFDRYFIVLMLTSNILSRYLIEYFLS